MEIAKKDIKTRTDLLVLLEEFYKKILADDSINYIFTKVARLDIQSHIPVIADFWETVVFQTGHYQKNAMQIHAELDKKSTLTPHHFETWLTYFNETVDELFEGDNAFLIKQRAASIATIMQIRIRQSN